MGTPRRIFLQMGAGAILATAIHSCAQTSSTKSGSTTTAASSGKTETEKKIIIGFWPIAAGLPV
jgi:hypothetical protein